MSLFRPTEWSRSTKVAIPVAILAVSFAGILFLETGPTPEPPVVAKEPVHRKITPPPVLDSGDTESAITTRRKETYGLEQGVDLVLRSDETLKLGSRTLEMRTFEEKDALDKGEIVALDLTGAEPSNQREYGIHFVRKGDNLWNLHFRIIREYYAKRGVDVSLAADEPNRKGQSSGIGKLLKFSEGMVRIYNLRTGDFESNLSQIQADEKVVIYKMEEVAALLDSIDYSRVEQIRFDGAQLWVPSP